MRRLPAVAAAWSRRNLLVAGASGIFAAAGFSLASLARKPDQPINLDLLRHFIGDRQVHSGRILLQVPPVADNSRVVPVLVSVESPMTEQDYVRLVRLLVPGNVDAEAATYHFTPDCGRARVDFRCRLRRTTPVIALAP